MPLQRLALFPVPRAPPPRVAGGPARSAGLALLVLLALVSGCATGGGPAGPALAPQGAGWPVDVPPGWAAADAAGGRAADAESPTAWWLRFDDPLLADLVGRALRSNNSVAGASAALRQAQGLRDVAAAGLLPAVGASGSAERSRLGGAAGASSSQFQLGLDAQWAPDVFGARRSALAAGNAVVGAAAASLGDTQVQVAAELAANYIALRLAQARWRIASGNLASQQETWQITDWRQQAGLVTVLEVEQARAAAAQTQALLPALQTSIEQTAHALAVLVGQPPASLMAELNIAPAVPAATAAAWVAPGQYMVLREAEAGSAPAGRGEMAISIPADTLRQRADVRAAEYQVAAALARVGQAQAQRWPSFALGGAIGLSALSAAALSNGASVVGSLLASVSLPVFDGGAARAQVRVQQAALEQAQVQYRATVLGALKDVEDALVARRGSRLRLASLRTAAEAADNAALLARQRYSSGLVDFQTVLETQRNALATQDSVVTARADIGASEVRLFAALGGGWRLAEERTDATPARTP